MSHKPQSVHLSRDMIKSNLSTGVCELKAGTHQADFKELATTKADGVVASRQLRLDQKAVLEHTTQTTADSNLTHVLCTRMTVISCRYRQLSIAFVNRHLKGETETRIYKIYET